MYTPFADSTDLHNNYLCAVLISNLLNINVKLRPHIDASVLLNTKNPEYLINNKIGERKAPKGLNFRNIFNKAVKQGSEVVVVDLVDNPNSYDEVKTKIIKHLIKPNNYKLIKEVILISKDRKKVEHIKRSNLK